MNESRIILVVFGLFAVPLIAAPLATVLFATRPGPSSKGIDGEISKAFLDAHADGGASSATHPVMGIDHLLPKGMPEQQVFDKFTTSGFTCAADANAATCFRSYESASCREDWKVRVIFSDGGTVWSDKAERNATCL